VGERQFLSATFHGKAHALHYKLYIPGGERGTPMPLVVMLHGCGQTADDFARGTGMNELAESVQCLVLYPEQSSQASWNHCWNCYEQAHHKRDEGEAAIIAGLTQSIIEQYGAVRACVSIAGLSSGGAMAVIMGRSYPDLFKEVGCHSGLAHRSATDTISAMSAMRGSSELSSARQAVSEASTPIIVFNGDVDSTVHQKNSAHVVRQSIECYQAQPPGEAGGMAMLEETGEASGRCFTRHIHRTMTGGVVAENWIIHGTGHAWSGGNASGTYTDPRGPDASREMLRFFMEQ
jgi:poly(hydroxyalkanoate) depolymerase family esterase